MQLHLPDSPVIIFNMHLQLWQFWRSFYLMQLQLWRFLELISHTFGCTSHALNWVVAASCKEAFPNLLFFVFFWMSLPFSFQGFFPKDFRVSASIRNPCFLVVFLAISKKARKIRSGFASALTYHWDHNRMEGVIPQAVQSLASAVRVMLVANRLEGSYCIGSKKKSSVRYFSTRGLGNPWSAPWISVVFVISVDFVISANSALNSLFVQARKKEHKD